MQGSSTCDVLLRGAQTAKNILQMAGMRYKMKTLVGFYQCVSAVLSVFGVEPLLGLEEYTHWINFLELPSEFENIFVSCADCSPGPGKHITWAK